MGETITVAWPAAPLGEPGWRTRLDDLATKAERLIGKDCGPQQAAELAMELVGILWPVIGAPETIAATCRASLLVGPPGIVAASPAGDQLAEIADRLDEIWHQAQQHPGAGVVQLAPPMLQQVAPAPKRARTRAALEPAPADADADADELPEAWRNHAEPTPPPGWWPAAEVGQLLGLNRSAVCRRRNAGALGTEGSGWLKCGKTYFYSEEAVTAAMEANEPMQQLNALVAEIQSEQ